MERTLGGECKVGWMEGRRGHRWKLALKKDVGVTFYLGMYLFPV